MNAELVVLTLHNRERPTWLVWPLGENEKQVEVRHRYTEIRNGIMCKNLECSSHTEPNCPHVRAVLSHLKVMRGAGG
jgi:hypothetical protein